MSSVLTFDTNRTVTAATVTKNLYCLPPNTTYFVPVGSLPYYMGFYVFPLVFIIGLTGNILNLIVLNSRGMRTKANCFLSAMAVVDLCFLLVMFVLNLTVYDPMASSDDFVKFHFYTKMTFVALANGFSSSSIWFSVVVTVERLVAIRTPLRARSFWKAWRIVFIVGCILFISFMSQLYNYFFLTPVSRPNCFDKNRQVFAWRKLRPDNNDVLFQYVRISMIVVPTVQVTLPLVSLVLLNSLLIYYLWINRSSVTRLGKSDGQKFNGHQSNNNPNKEWKITMTVLTIVFTFFIFNFPSTIMYWLTTQQLLPNTSDVFKLTYMLNFLVTVNKSMNFVLYCTSSASFRRKLIALFRGDDGTKRSTYSVTTTRTDTRDRRYSLRDMDKINGYDSPEHRHERQKLL